MSGPDTSDPDLELDRTSLLVHVAGATTLGELTRALDREGLRLPLVQAIDPGSPEARESVAAWLARGAPGVASALLDPADHLVAGLGATLSNGDVIDVRPAPRRAVGPDLIALAVGANGRFASIDHVWLRVHLPDEAVRPSPVDGIDVDPPVSPAEAALLDAIARELAR